jgi:hypothetical protein
MLGLVLSVGAVSLAFLLRPQTARAQPNCAAGPYIDFGTYEFCGYYDNHFDNLGLDVVNGGVPNWVVGPGTFITWMKNLWNAGPGTQDRTAEEFIVDTFNGEYPPNNIRVHGNPAGPWFATFERKVRGYDAINKVDWDTPIGWWCGQENTFYQDNWNDETFYKTFPGDGSGCGAGITRPAIVFRDPTTNRVLYTIKRNCANPVGNLSPIPEPPYNLTGSLTPGPAGPPPSNSTPAFGGIIQPGLTYNLTPAVKDNGPVAAQPFRMEVENLTPALAKNAGISAPGGQDTGSGYRVGTCASAAAECWQWAYGNGLNANSTSTQSNGAAFTVVASARQGSTVCFRLYVHPSDESGGTVYEPSANGSYCFLVYSPVYPAFTASNGDVHAGGGKCGGTLSNTGAVTGNPAAGSTGQYVVSAVSGGGINGFGSNGVPASSVLNLGSAGNYTSLCRQDLWQAALDYMATSGYGPVVGSLDVGSLNPAYNVFVANGTVKLHGTIGRKLTIIGDTGADIEIDGNLQIDNGTYPVNGLPSLGIISHHGILIHSSVTRVDAYMFADGVIDTCMEANASCQSPALVINGFLMADSLSFHRLGPAGAKGPVLAEQVSLNPQIYLNPPLIFDSASDSNVTQTESEGRPLY